MYLLDTNICIKIMNKTIDVVFEAKRSEGVAVSVITCAELEYGIAKSKYYEENKKILLTFLTLVDILPFDYDASVHYGDIKSDLEKRGCVIGNMDMMIAAHARSQGLTVVTNNTREFERVDGLKLEDWV